MFRHLQELSFISDQAIAPLGVLAGVEFVDSVTGKTTFKNYWPGSNAVSVDTDFPVKAFVHDDPMQLYVVVADGTNTNRATALADIFINCDMASVNNGSTATGRSSDMLDISTAATTIHLMLGLWVFTKMQQTQIILQLVINTS